MTSLTQLRTYGSDTDDESDENQEERLPLPDFIGKVSANKVVKEENLEGKIRNFPHEPGNWATFVYLPVESTCDFLKYLNKLVSHFEPLNLRPVDDFHISLTKTVILRHHWIEDFTKTIKDRLAKVYSFRIHLSGLKVYVNEQRTRSFLSLGVDEGEDELRSIVNRLDDCLRDYNLEGFFDDPSFHMSLLWCPSDGSEEINKLIDLLPLKMKNFGFYMDVTCCVCLSGNKKFIFNFFPPTMARA